jgi:nucleoside-diphosphate-sugar epimerase
MDDLEQKKSALILGATGGIGGAIARALLDHGWEVRGLVRNVEKARAQPVTGSAIAWISGDAIRAEDVVRAADGVSIIVHAVNPPGYADWDKLVLPMLDNTIAAARAAGGARVVLPGTIYNYDPARTPVITADSPQIPQSRKGAIRVEMEKRLVDAAPDVPSLILRAGDFFGPGARASWFSQAMIAPGKPVSRIVNPARGGGHSWAYLPDLAEAFAQLLDSDDKLDTSERVQFEGLYDGNGKQMTEGLRRVTDRTLPERKFPWWLMQILAPFAVFPREATEIAPYWRHPVKLDNTRLTQLIGEEPHTSLDQALAATLADMGSLPD